MNYRHGFHAGNFADAHKHIVLVALIDYLARKPAAFGVLDTHAGRGDYALGEGQAARTGEFTDGIARLMDAADAPLPARRYLNLVRAWNRERHGRDTLLVYPGSPRLARLVLRPQDRLHCCELQPEEQALLKAHFRGDEQVAVHARDGWEALRGLLPLREKRGLVLIDPPYERQEDELTQAADALAEAHRRFPTGVLALWYPIKESSVIARFHRRLERAGIGRLLICELCVWPDEGRLHLNGSGLAIVNPPWTLEASLRETMPWLWRQLAHDGLGRHRVSWIANDEQRH